MNEDAEKKEQNQREVDARRSADADRVRELRERLYARGNAQKGTVRHQLPPQPPKVVATESVVSPETHRAPVVPTPIMQEREVPPEDIRGESAVSYDSSMATLRRKMLRKKIALWGMGFFLVAVVASGLLLFLGNNTISGENISISASGPIAVGGGDEFSYQVSIANQNTVPIQSATLIIEYPRGTQNPNDGKEIIVERKALDVIDSGELVNVPLKARVFGEENEEKEIKVSIDYRVKGSNATFHKETDPLRFKISTSPVIITFDSIKTISSGQEFELTLNVQSNSPSPLSDLLVKLSYPSGFDFSESEPETITGEDVWRIATLKPTEKKTITIRGLVTGYEDEMRTFTAAIGVAHATDKNTLASTLSQAQTEILIEQPFLGVGVTINGDTKDTVVVDNRDVAIVEIKFENTTDATIYDGKIVVDLAGNALNEFEVRSTDGFYDSTRNIISWDSVDTKSLKEILPGQKSSVFFTLDPEEDIGKTPVMDIKVTMKGSRVFESNTAEELIGTAERTIKIESIPTIYGRALYKTGAFVNTGPTPPVAEKVTQYTFVLTVLAGANDLTGAEVTAVLPQYVRWLDLVTDGDDITYNPTTRTIKWVIGNMDAGSEESVSMQVSFTPSLTQVGVTPTILETQRFRATDRFTGTTVRTDHAGITTSLTDEVDTKYHDGRVRSDE